MGSIDDSPAYMDDFVDTHYNSLNEPERKDQYVLGRGFSSSVRIWLLDLNRSGELHGLKVGRLHGFDISPGNFTNTAWLPDKIQFGLSNLLQDPPREFWGTFDVVHLRLVMLLTVFGDIRSIISHVYKLLKPGGLLQWEELDIVNNLRTLVKDPSIDPRATAMEKVYEQSRTVGDFSWTIKLPEILESEGFVDARHDAHQPPPELYQAWTCSDLVGAAELCCAPSMPANAAEKLRACIDTAWGSEVTRFGAFAKTVPLVTVARKPVA